MENNQHVELRLAAELKTSTCTALSHVDISISSKLCAGILSDIYIYMRYILDECYMYIIKPSRSKPSVWALQHARCPLANACAESEEEAHQRQPE